MISIIKKRTNFMSNTAKDVIIPEDPNVFRTVFLYVGQGESTLLAIPEGEDYNYVLIDSNQDEESGGIEIVNLLNDLFDGEKKELLVYINTHPHKDHLKNIKQIYDKIGIKQLWHSGHKPGKDHKESYEELNYVIKKLGEKNVFRLRGSKVDNKLDEELIILGDITYNVLAPADYVSDEIDKEKPDDRYARIHEQCGVIRFKYGENQKQILITGDADYKAWKENITKYHKDRLNSTVLSAAHHGSRSFFWENSDTDKEPYKEHLDNIDPSYVVVSAPKDKESKHDHPHKEAVALYKDKVGDDNVFHLGEKRECIIVDIYSDGDINIYPDSDLVKKYGKKDNDKGGSGERIAMSSIVSKIDRKPMGE